MKKVKNRLSGDFEYNYGKVSTSSEQIYFSKGENSNAALRQKAMNKFLETGSESDRALAEKYSKTLFTSGRNVPIAEIGTFDIIGSGTAFHKKYGSWGEWLSSIVETQANINEIQEKYPGALKYMERLLLNEFFDQAFKVNANTEEDNQRILNWFEKNGIEIGDQGMDKIGNFFEYKVGSHGDGVEVTGRYYYKVTNEVYNQ
ncbi:MAG: hypothetical protein CMC96_03665 [Flavobacteriales bacterium]|nr:hypothetical protein [Flavobacteriales bacterium]